MLGQSIDFNALFSWHAFMEAETGVILVKSCECDDDEKAPGAMFDIPSDMNIILSSLPLKKEELAADEVMVVMTAHDKWARWLALLAVQKMKPKDSIEVFLRKTDTCSKCTFKYVKEKMEAMGDGAKRAVVVM